MSYGGLLNFLWRTQVLVGQAFTGEAGERIEVVSTGEEAPENDPVGGEQAGVWLGAEIVVDGERRRGTVVVGGAGRPAMGVDQSASYSPIGRVGSVGGELSRMHAGARGTAFGESRNSHGTTLAGELRNAHGMAPGLVLRVVAGHEPAVLGSDDRLVPQVTYEIDSQIVAAYDELRKGAAAKACAAKIAALDPLRRTELLTASMVRRLQRKTERIGRIFRSTDKDWNQTFWVLLLEVMGGNRNREAYSELAQRLTMVTVSREKLSATTVENLILGAAGLLDADNWRGAEEFRHLALKHSIVPLRAAEWDTARILPANHPRNRLRQIAALVARHDFLLDRVLDCLNREDVEELFSLPGPPPGVPLSRSAGRMGTSKAHLIGINLVAPLMFAYGKETGRAELCERALDVLAGIPAESNSKLNGWYSGGLAARDAFESQALLELGNEFCAREACAECRFGRGEIAAVLKKFRIFAG